MTGCRCLTEWQLLTSFSKASEVISEVDVRREKIKHKCQSPNSYETINPINSKTVWKDITSHKNPLGSGVIFELEITFRVWKENYWIEKDVFKEVWKSNLRAKTFKYIFSHSCFAIEHQTQGMWKTRQSALDSW